MNSRRSFDVSVGTVHTAVRCLGNDNVRTHLVPQTAYGITAGAFAALRGSGRRLFAMVCDS
jgi:hypothetical protein